MESHHTYKQEISIPEALDFIKKPVQAIPLNRRIEELPLEKLTWPQFESLCLHLLERTYRDIPNHKLGEAFRYGLAGQSQDGIDLIVTDHSSGKYIVAECKHTIKISREKINEVREKFLKSNKYSNTKTFILCTSDSVKDKKAIDAWIFFEKELSNAGITAELWHSPKIDLKLRDLSEIVEIFFGQEHAIRFCNAPKPVATLSKEFPEKKTTEIMDGWRISNKSSSVSFFLPNENRTHLSCGIEFARQDLSGVSLAIDGRKFIEIIQHRHHAKSLYETPFIINLHETEKYVLTLSGAQLVLTRREVDELDWVIEKSWDKYFSRISELEKKWKILRFEKIRTEKFTFGLCRIESWFWHEIMAYCDQHDYEHSTSDDCIFDAAPSCLKVFTPHTTKNLDAGYHVIMYAYTDPGIHLNNNHYITIGWSPLQDISGHPVTVSHRKALNAEATHQWLINDLFPKVWKWTIERHKKSNKGILGIAFKKFKKTKYRNLESFARSSAHFTPKDLGRRPSSHSEALALASLLQSHFRPFNTLPKIEFNLVKCCLQACTLFIDRTPGRDTNYIQKILRLENQNNVIAEIQEIIDCITPEKYATMGYLNRALDCLYSIINANPQIINTTFEDLTDFLAPVWDRYVEDMLCSKYH